MKNKMKIRLTTVLASLFLFSGLAFGEYYSRGYGYDDDYADYEYRFDDAVYHLDRYQDPVYYFRHDRADVYFLLVGDIIFVVPAYSLSPYLHRHNFVWVPRTRFISLSCGGLDYYDSYLRFNFYFDFYNRSKWSRGHHHRLRRDFRSYYNSRKQHTWYQENRQRIMQQIGVDSPLKKYDNSRNYNSSESLQKKYSKGSDNYKNHVIKRKIQEQKSRYSYRDRIKRKNESH